MKKSYAITLLLQGKIESKRKYTDRNSRHLLSGKNVWWVAVGDSISCLLGVLVR